MTDPRDGRRVALKKLPNVFQSLVSSKRVFRELKMLCFFKHENVSDGKTLLVVGVLFSSFSVSLLYSFRNSLPARKCVIKQEHIINSYNIVEYVD